MILVAIWSFRDRLRVNFLAFCLTSGYYRTDFLPKEAIMKDLFSRFRLPFLGRARDGGTTVALVASMGGAVVAPGSAHAYGTMGTIASGGSAQMQSIGNLMIQGAFFFGLGLTGFGIHGLVKASKPNSQETYGQGLWKIAAGGGLACLPAITGVSIGTIFDGGATTTATMTTSTFTN